MELNGLGYIGLNVPDPAAWLTFATDVIGVMPARALPGESFGIPAMPGSGPASAGSGTGPDGSVYLKIDDRQWRIGLHRADAPGVAYLGFEVAHADGLAAAVAELAGKGVTATAGTAEECAARGVAGLAWLTDPGGHRVELFHTPVNDFKWAAPFGNRFVTGELGLGHALMFCADMDASLAFYIDVLGFRRSDFIGFGPGMSAQFLRCTPRHHSIGLVHVGPFAGVHHLMLEVPSVDLVGAALDRAEAAGITITTTLGRHRNDNMLSFYMASPAGIDVEIGCEGTIVGDDWCDREFVEGDIWGHKGITPETLEAAAEGMA